jgi:serine protease Do
MTFTRLVWSALVLALTTVAFAADEKEFPPVPPVVPAEKLPAVLESGTPTTLEELKEIQAQTRKVIEKVTPATVGLRVGGASGSGVIVNEGGLILTAAHVSGKPGTSVDVIFPDGKILKAKSLGQNTKIDSGMVQINEEGKYPFVPMGKSDGLAKGTWVLTLGHPGGYKPGRSPVVRLGRVLTASSSVIRTDCTLVGGDSGGPLFDLHGQLVGIHSRIGESIRENMHVPVDTYRDTWDRLVKSESWGGGIFGTGGTPAAPAQAYLGLQFDPDTKEPKVIEVAKDSPAAKAGIQVGDLLSQFDGKAVKTFEELTALLTKRKPGDEVKVEVMREDKSVTLKLTLGKKPG